MNKHKRKAADADTVLSQVRKLREKQGAAKPAEGPSTLSNVREVSEMPAEVVVAEIERLVRAHASVCAFVCADRSRPQFAEALETIMQGNSFSFQVPSKAASNQEYIAALDRNVLRDKTSERQFLNVNQARKTAITTRVFQLVHQVAGKRIHVTKRDLFYTDVKLFKKQEESDAVLDDVAATIGCPRTCLHVVAADKGLVVGRISFREDGDLIDCTRMGARAWRNARLANARAESVCTRPGVTGKAIPSHIDKITDIRSDAEFILVRVVKAPSLPRHSDRARARAARSSSRRMPRTTASPRTGSTTRTHASSSRVRGSRTWRRACSSSG